MLVSSGTNSGAVGLPVRIISRAGAVLGQAWMGPPRLGHAWLAMIFSFVLLGALRALASPLADTKGAFPDEVYHFARSLQTAGWMADALRMPAPRYSEQELISLAANVDDVCQLGVSFGGSCKAVDDPMWGSDEKRQGMAVYLFHGLAQLLFQASDTYSRILLARLVSIAVGVGLAWVVFQIGLLVFNDKRLAGASAALTVLVPSVNNIVTVVATEGPALFAVAFLLLAAVRIWVGGISAGRLLALGLGILVCLFSKVTALAVLPVAALLTLHGVGFQWRGILLAALVGATGLVMVVMQDGFVPAGVANWYETRSPWLVPIHGSRVSLAQHSRDDRSPPPLGQWAISGNSFAGPRGRPLAGIVQFLPRKVTSRLAGKRITVGSWIQSISNDDTVVSSSIDDGLVPRVVFAYDSVDQRTLANSVVVQPNLGWEFVAYEVAVPAKVHDVGILLPQPPSSLNRLVSWDGVMLVEGSFAAASGQVPSFDDASARAGKWGGTRFVNLIRNGSGENVWQSLPSSTRDRLMPNATWANRMDGQLFSLYDLERTGSGYVSGLRAIFATFWGSFLGGDVPGLSSMHYSVAAAVLSLAGVGWVRRARRPARESDVQHGPSAMPSMVGLAFLLTLLLYGAMCVGRMDVSAEWVPPLFYATARYMLPAITPVVLLSVAGVSQLFPKQITRVVLATLVAGVYLANVWMLVHVEIPYYACPHEIRWDCTPL